MAENKGDRLVPAKPAAPVEKPNANGAGAAGQQCESSSIFNNIIDDVARRIFDPADLGDIAKLKTKYNCEIKASNDPWKYAKQALNKDDKDPYTSFLNEKDYSRFQDSVRGKVVGTGVTLVMPTALDDKTGARPPLIVQDFDSTAARGQGLKPGDQILAVDGVGMSGKTWRDGLNALDGAENSTAKVRILRNGVESDVQLKRTKEQVSNVEHKMVDGKFAHIRVKTFMHESTSAQIESAILDNPKAQGYIIDLRHNGGGLLDQAFTSASLFIKEGEVLSIKSRVPSDPSKPEYSMQTYALSKDLITAAQNNAKPKPYMPRHEDRVNKPVVVLVDQGTASAAEILAGALKDTDGAYVVGTPTYGKGVGQSVIPDLMSGGATKVTTFRYYTPSGFWPGDGHATRIGIQPNLVVKNPEPSNYYTQNDGQLNAAIGYLRTK